MKTKILAFIGFIVLLFVALLTGGIGAILLLLKSETLRDLFAKAFADFITHKIFVGEGYDDIDEVMEAQAAFNDFAAEQAKKNDD